MTSSPISPFPLVIACFKRPFSYLRTILRPSSFHDKTPIFSARNLAAGTVRQLDSNVAKDRKLAYKVFELVKLGDTPESEMPSIADSCKYLAEQGFDVVEHQVVNRDNVEEYMATFQPEEYKYL